MISARRRAPWGTALVLLCACDADRPDPLGRDIVAELSRATGNATGTDRSGLWVARVDQTICECSEELKELACTADAQQGVATAVEIIEASGFMVIRGGLAGPTSNLLYETSGAIDEDGEFSLGFVEIALSLDVEFETIARFDGQFTDDDDSFFGTMQFRLDGSVGDVSGDCYSVIELDGTRNR